MAATIIYKVSLIVKFATQPAAGGPPIFSGKYSESLWTNVAAGAILANVQALAAVRARMLPASCQIVGYRTQAYTINTGSNRLLPGGVTSGALNYPGQNSLTLQGPWSGTRFSIPAVGNNNFSNHTLRCWPAEWTQGGDYKIAGNTVTTVRNWANTVASGPWGFVGRDLSEPTFQVTGITGPVVLAGVTYPASVVIQGVGPGSAGDYRLYRCKDNNGINVQGVYPFATQVVGTPAGGTTLYFNKPILNVEGNVPAPGADFRGLIRFDVLKYFVSGVPEVVRLSERKVGFSKDYHGRRSRKVA